MPSRSRMASTYSTLVRRRKAGCVMFRPDAADCKAPRTTQTKPARSEEEGLGLAGGIDSFSTRAANLVHGAGS